MKQFFRILLLLLIILFSFSYVSTTYAVDDTEIIGEESGYIIRLKDSAPVLFSMRSSSSVSAEPVPYAEGFYLVQNLEDIKPWIDNGLVEYIKPNKELELLEDSLTNDPEVVNQWYLETIDAVSAWNADLTGDGVKVAIIDSGIYLNHEDLDYNNISGYSFLGNGEHSDSYYDRTGHGTFVTGILAAQKDNEKGIAGLTDEAQILSLRCFSDNESDDYDRGSGTVAVVLSAIGYAMEQNVDVINMSFGGYNRETLLPLEEKLKEAASQGIILVASSGNDNTTADMYPAAFDCVIGVGAVDRYETVVEEYNHNSSVFVTAPGFDIIGLDYDLENSYRKDSGTSFSAPMVSSLAVMVKETEPAITNDGFKKLLRASIVDLGTEGYDIFYGYGLINVELLLNALEKSYAINYECDEGSLLGVEGTDYYVSYTIGSLTNLPVPVKDGYTFAGWYDNTGYDGEAMSQVPAETVGDVTYYAKWYDDLETKVKSISMKGCVATQSEENPYVYSVELATGTDLSKIITEDIEVIASSSNAAISNIVTSDSGVTWSFNVTGSELNNTKTYTINVTLADNNYAPVVTQMTRLGSATSESLDGLIMGQPYTDNMSSWFTDTEGEVLTYEMISVSSSAIDTVADGEVTISGSALIYTPASGDAGKNVDITVRAYDGSFYSTENVIVTIAVEDLPVSNSVISPVSAIFDQYTKSDICSDIEIALNLYGNTLKSIKNNYVNLIADTDYTITADIDISNGTVLKIKKEYLMNKEIGGLALTLEFSKGNNLDLNINIINSFVAVTDVTGVISEVTKGTETTLSVTVEPTNATNKNVIWSVKSAGSTGAIISEGKLFTENEGTVIVTATIIEGLAGGIDYTRDFEIIVEESSSDDGGGVCTKVSVKGYEATKSEENPYVYSVELPTGTNLSEIITEDIEVIVKSSSLGVSNITTSDSGVTWSFSVTGSDPNNINTYTINVTLADNNYAPIITQQARLGSATPKSLDGLTAAQPYLGNMSSWFTDTEESVLTYEIVSVSSFAIDAVADGEVTISGSALTYTPASGDAGKNVDITIRAYDGSFYSTENVIVTIAVEDLPVSNSVISPMSAKFDQYTKSDNFCDIEIAMSLYGNTLASIKNNDEHLVADTDYTITADTDISNDTVLKIKKEYLINKEIGDLALILEFSEGNNVGFNEGNNVNLNIKIINSFVAVTDITGVISEVTKGTETTLSGTVEPTNATNKNVIWSVKAQGNTGAIISENKLLTENAGTVIVTATIIEGLAGGIDYTKDFEIIVKEASSGGNAGGGSPGGGNIGGGSPGGGNDGGDIPDGGDSSIIEEPTVEEPEPPLKLQWENNFTDVVEENWYYDSVEFVCSRGLFKGISDDSFSPDKSMTRAMLVTVLHRLSGKSADNSLPSQDVSEKKWYDDAVQWAYEKGITTGTTTGFNPEEKITREQLVTMLYRYVLIEDLSVNENMKEISDFEDYDTISSWAEDAMTWAVKTGLINGRTGGYLDPKDEATRAEVSTFIQRFYEMITIEDASN